MAPAKFKQLTFGRIEEGKLAGDLDQQLDRVNRAMCAYVEEHGEAANKATATITLKIKVKCQDVDDGIFIVTGSIAANVPARPARSTAAIVSADEDDNPCLFARASGSTEGNPAQLKMTTDDGQVIDPATGEIKPAKSKK